MSIMYPSGYGTRERSLDDLMARHCRPEFTEPEFRRRLRHWLESKGGQVGIGDVLPRSSGDTISAASTSNRSFHQLQKFADGTTWACAVDLVVRRPGSTHSSGAVPVSLVPLQGSLDAARFGVHINIGAPGQSGFEPWHMQPIEIDGWWTWSVQGRPRPKPNHPLPGTVSTVPQPIASPEPTPKGTFMVNGQAVTLPTIRQGDNGKHVHLWQRIIGATPDGDFGPQTDRLTRIAQKMLGVTVDGVVGPITWAAALS